MTTVLLTLVLTLLVAAVVGLALQASRTVFGMAMYCLNVGTLVEAFGKVCGELFAAATKA